MLYELIHYLENHRNVFGLPENERLAVELLAPWRLSRTGRCRYLARSQEDDRRLLVIQDSRSIFGLVETQNPYQPRFHKKVERYLPARRGSFLFKGKTYYWAGYLQEKSLHSSLKNSPIDRAWKSLAAFAQEYGQWQLADAASSDLFLEGLLDLIRSGMDQPILQNWFDHYVSSRIDLCRQYSPLLCSWSHGDLWPAEIFIGDNSWKILDWEWSLEAAPIGSDLIDFYVTLGEHVLEVPISKAWEGLFQDGLPQLSPLRKELMILWSQAGIDPKAREGILCYALLRSLSRVLVQEGFSGLDLVNTYLEIFSSLEKGLFPLVDGLRGISINEPGISIIVPTCNRADHLTIALDSIINQPFPAQEYEILVIDNGSKDHTRQVVEKAIAEHVNIQIKYIYEPEPGLLSGRHRGAREACGQILVFVDDDIKAVPGWLAAINESFQNPEVHLVGGPSLPSFETPPPAWIAPYCQMKNGHLICIPLSLIDLGERMVEIDPTYVIGLNFAIRKKTLLELGGFHPDNISKHLQQFQGDGETGLASKIKSSGYKAFYHPGAKVFHRIPADRLSVEAFQQRFFYQGVCDSYSAIRKRGTTAGISEPVFDPDDPTVPKHPEYDDYYRRIHHAYVDGFLFHLKAVRQWPQLLNWVVRKDYFDYKLPVLMADRPGPPDKIKSTLAAPYPKNLATEQILSLTARKKIEEANLLIAQAQYMPALQLLDEAMYLYPDISDLQSIRVICLQNLGRIKEAKMVGQEKIRCP